MRTRYILLIACCLWAASASANTGDDVRVSGARVVAPSEVIEGNLIVMTGDLVVHGTVHGSCIAHVGDIILEATAVVHGDVVAKCGRVIRTSGAAVTGSIVQGRKPKPSTGRSGMQLGND